MSADVPKQIVVDVKTGAGDALVERMEAVDLETLVGLSYWYMFELDQHLS
jgi:hypothetical protein